jgi:hypothetical protein
MILFGHRRVCRGFTLLFNMGAGQTLTLPLVNTRSEGSLSYNCYVNWGDKSSSHVTAYNDPNASHTYASAGYYAVEIRGTCEGFSFNNGGNKANLIKIVDWGRPPVFAGFKYLSHGFYGCANLTAIDPSPIPASGTGILIDGFFYIFAGCTSLSAIPANLFKYNPSVSIYAFFHAFDGCTSLTSIPIDLFRYNTAVSTSGFVYVFHGCTSLTAIPIDLFRYNTAVTSFNSAFGNCSALVSVPNDLFRYNTAVGANGFDTAFFACNKLQVNPTTWFEPGEETTRFLNLASSFFQTFYRTGFSGVLGTAPALWMCDFGETITLSTAPATDWAPGDTITGQSSGATALVVSKVSSLVYKIKQHFGTFVLGESVGVTGTPTKICAEDGSHPIFAGTPTSTQCFAGAGNSLASLSNYASIPASWK